MNNAGETVRLLVRFITISSESTRRSQGSCSEFHRSLPESSQCCCRQKELTRLIHNHYDDSTGMWRRAFPISATNVLRLTRDVVQRSGACEYQSLSRVRHPSPIRRRRGRNLSLPPQSEIHILLPVLSVGCYSRRGYEVMPAFSHNLLALWINPHNTPPR